MENAAYAVIEAMGHEHSPLSSRRVVVFCGKGNNGGDGLAIARGLLRRVAALHVLLAGKPEELSGDAAANYKMLRASGGDVVFEVSDEMRRADIVVDALLGTGLRGPVQGKYLELIRSINEDFPIAKIVAVDIPSGMLVRADLTVTFTAPKPELIFGDLPGKLIVAPIGTPPELIQSDLEVSEAGDFAPLFAPRKPDANKGNYGHVLLIGGGPGKTGAAAMAGLAALRAGAGLVTVACADPSLLAPELMSDSLDHFTLEKITVVAVGPGLGKNAELLVRLMKEVTVPMVIDADGLNSIAGTDFRGRGVETILTPHPGEMARLLGRPVKDRLADARSFAKERNMCLVLKGHRTLIALPDGRVWVNPTGSPAMATGGTGDVLTGLTAGLVAQFPNDIPTAVRAAVWLHGRAGQIGAVELTEQCLIATDLLHYLPRAIRETTTSSISFGLK
jgi:NAD(P)H-hydrate epimerase